MVGSSPDGKPGAAHGARDRLTGSMLIEGYSFNGGSDWLGSHAGYGRASRSAITGMGVIVATRGAERIAMWLAERAGTSL